jgi:hypothetical protein
MSITGLGLIAGCARASATGRVSVSDQPEPSERGRYAIYEQPDGGLVIPRSAPLCESCASCGCGEQQEPLRIPGALVRMARAAAEGKGNGLAGKIKGMMSL